MDCLELLAINGTTHFAFSGFQPHAKSASPSAHNSLEPHNSASRPTTTIKKTITKVIVFFIWAAVDCLELLAINGATHFAFSGFQPHAKSASPSARNSLEPHSSASRPTTTIKKTITKVIVFFIWAAVDSNHRPHPYQGCALTT